MNYNLSVLIAFVFLLLTAAAERLTAFHVRSLKDESAALTRKLDNLSDRVSGALAEEAKYQKAEALAAEVKRRMTPESDSSSVLQWFDSNAAKTGVILVSNKVAPPDKSAEVGPYQRIRMEVRLQGAYLGLLQYVEGVERSSMPMVVDSCSLSSAREMPGTGDMALTVSCLFPTSEEKTPERGGTQ